MFKNSWQTAFVAAFFKTYNKNLHSYKTDFDASEKTSAMMILSTFNSDCSESFNIIFLFFKISELQISEKFKRVKVLVEENNELNKKIHMNSNFSSAQLKEQIFHSEHNFQNRSKKKNLKRIKKTVDFFSLINIMNKIINIFDKSISIRQVFKNTQINILFINFFM